MNPCVKFGNVGLENHATTCLNRDGYGMLRPVRRSDISECCANRQFRHRTGNRGSAAPSSSCISSTRGRTLKGCRLVGKFSSAVPHLSPQIWSLGPGGLEGRLPEQQCFYMSNLIETSHTKRLFWTAAYALESLSVFSVEHTFYFLRSHMSIARAGSYLQSPDLAMYSLLVSLAIWCHHSH